MHPSLRTVHAFFFFLFFFVCPFAHDALFFFLLFFLHYSTSLSLFVPRTFSFSCLTWKKLWVVQWLETFGQQYTRSRVPTQVEPTVLFFRRNLQLPHCGHNKLCQSRKLPTFICSPIPREAPITQYALTESMSIA